jgi:hypothetical protein
LSQNERRRETAAEKLDSPFQAGRENSRIGRCEKDFSKTACDWHGLG